MKRSASRLFHPCLAYLGCALVSALFGCGKGTPSGGLTVAQRNAAALGAPEDPCNARNPVAQAHLLLERHGGPPDSAQVNFAYPSARLSCLRRTDAADASGHRATSAEVSLDGSILWGPSDFKQSVAGAQAEEILQGGAHTLSGQIQSKPGTSVAVDVLVAGPVVDRLDKVFGPTGTVVHISGSSLDGHVRVFSGATELTVQAVDPSGSLVTVVTVDGMPIGPFEVQNEWGSAFSSQIFLPQTPKGIVKLYDPTALSDAIGDGVPDISSVSITDDGRTLGIRVAFANPLPPTFQVTISVNPMGDASATVTTSFDGTTTSSTLGSQVTMASDLSNVVFSGDMRALGLFGTENLGSFFLSVKATTPGQTPDTFPDHGPSALIRSGVAPMVLVYRSNIAPDAFAARFGATFLLTIEDTDVSAMKIPDNMTLEETLFKVAADPDCNGVFIDPTLHATGTGPGGFPIGPTDCLTGTDPTPSAQALAEDLPANSNTTVTPFINQFSLWETDVPPAWATATGAGVTIIVIDGGINAHTNLTNLVASTDMLLFSDGVVGDEDGHGTQVASIAAAINGAGGMVGVAPGASLISIKAINRKGQSEGVSVLRAIMRANKLATGNATIKVVNISAAEWTIWPVTAAAVLAAFAVYPGLGVAIAALAAIVYDLEQSASTTLARLTSLVVSSGNNFIPGVGPVPNPPTGVLWPASTPEAITVGSVDDHRVHDSFSTTDPFGQVALVVPVGAGLVSSALFSNPVALLCSGGGTSFAAPQVTGAAAVLYSAAPTLTPAQVKALLKASAVPIGGVDPSNTSDAVGAGLMDLNGAIGLVSAVTHSWDLMVGTSRGSFPVDTAFSNHTRYFLMPGGGAVSAVLGPFGAEAFVPVTIPPGLGAPWQYIVGADSADSTGNVLLGGSFGSTTVTVFTIDSGAFVGTAVTLSAPLPAKPARVYAAPGRLAAIIGAGPFAEFATLSAPDSKTLSVVPQKIFPFATNLAVGTTPQPDGTVQVAVSTSVPIGTTQLWALTVQEYDPVGDSAVGAPVSGTIPHGPAGATVLNWPATVTNASFPAGFSIEGCAVTGAQPIWITTFGTHSAQMAVCGGQVVGQDFDLGHFFLPMIASPTKTVMYGFVAATGGDTGLFDTFNPVTGRGTLDQFLLGTGDEPLNGTIDSNGKSMIFVDGTCITDPNGKGAPICHGLQVVGL